MSPSLKSWFEKCFLNNWICAGINLDITKAPFQFSILDEIKTHHLLALIPICYSLNQTESHTDIFSGEQQCFTYHVPGSRSVLYPETSRPGGPAMCAHNSNRTNCQGKEVSSVQRFALVKSWIMN